MALLEARITPSQLVNSDNLAELLEESNTVNKQIKKENPSNIPTKNIPLPTKTFPKTSQPIKNSNIPMPINFQQQLEIPQEQKVFEINPEHNPAKQSNKKNETPKQNISQNTHEHPIHNIEKLPPQKTQEPEKHQTQPPFKSQERSNPPKKTQNIVQNFVKIKETADKHKEVQSQVYKFEKNIENQAVSYQDDQEDIEITYEKKTDNLEIIQDEM